MSRLAWPCPTISPLRSTRYPPAAMTLPGTGTSVAGRPIRSKVNLRFPLPKKFPSSYGTPDVVDVRPTDGISVRSLLQAAVTAGSRSEHPVGKAILIQELAHRFLRFVKDARRRLAPQEEAGVTSRTDFWKLHKHSKADKH